MTPPPINIDGTDITGATIDGQDVEQITIDGQDVLSAIPDTSMLDSPIYQYFAGNAGDSDGDSSVAFPEVLDSNQGDASVADGSPTYQADYENTGKDMVVFDASNPDYHSGELQSNFTDDNTISIFASYYMLDASSSRVAFSSLSTDGGGNDTGFGVGINNGQYALANTDGSSVRGGTPSANVLDTVGVSLSNGDSITVYGGGSEQASETESYTLDQSFEIGNWSTFSMTFDGGIFDIVISDSEEPLSNYQDYHNDRTA